MTYGQGHCLFVSLSVFFTHTSTHSPCRCLLVPGSIPTVRPRKLLFVSCSPQKIPAPARAGQTLIITTINLSARVIIYLVCLLPLLLKVQLFISGLILQEWSNKSNSRQILSLCHWPEEWPHFAFFHLVPEINRGVGFSGDLSVGLEN